jgi:protein-export membrane protein SecD
VNTLLFWKAGAFAAVLAIAAYLIYPNFVWYSLPLQQRQEQAKRKNPMAKEVIPLGLDLQGGVRLVYQIDVAKLSDESDETVRTAIEHNMLVVSRRIDALGVANASVLRQGRNLIVIEMPGVYGSEEAKSIIGKTALLEFRMVKEDEALVKILDLITQKNVQIEDVVSGRLPEEIKSLIPAGMELLPSRDGGYLLVSATPDLTGQYLKQARVDLGGGGAMVNVGGMAIGFELDSEGAALFEKLTAAHLNERLAIVLDDIIQSAPRIESRIPGGRGQITGSFTPQEAKNLASVLNSGNLQAPMHVVEERTVGPELGEDSIRSGLKAMGWGFLFVILFVAIYYKFSGVLADVALSLNLVFLVAAMASIKATMTLPGIAGIILSLAMAVDANVIILERVREELRKGRDARFAIEEGYSKAFSAIFDGNITGILAALMLFQFGTGPVRGFGITLILGLLISMITAVWVTKFFYEVWFAVAKPKTLSV